MGIGMAYGREKLLLEKINPIDLPMCLAGDGDLQEPIALGSSTLAGHWKLSNLDNVL